MMDYVPSKLKAGERLAWRQWTLFRDGESASVDGTLYVGPSWKEREAELTLDIYKGWDDYTQVVLGGPISAPRVTINKAPISLAGAHEIIRKWVSENLDRDDVEFE